MYVADPVYESEISPPRGTVAAAYHRIYPDECDFAASTATARVNGFLGGHGGPVRLAEEIGNLGLVGEARAALEQVVQKMHPSESCALPPA